MVVQQLEGFGINNVRGLLTANNNDDE